MDVNFRISVKKSRTYSLSGRDDNHLTASVAKGSRDEDLPEGEEAAQSPRLEILQHRARVIPIPKANSVVVRGATKGDDEHQQDKSNDSGQLDRTKDKFGFSIDAHWEAVDGHHWYEKDGDPDCVGH